MASLQCAGSRRSRCTSTHAQAGVKVEVISPSVSARQVSPPQPAAADAPLISSAAVPTQSAETVAPLSRGSAIRAAPLPSSEKVELVRRKQNRLLRHLQHESFLHPAASLSLSLLSLAYFILRLTTDLTIGDSYRMSAIVYWQHVPYIVASCLGVAGTLQLAASIAKLKLYNGWDGIAVTKKCLIGLCLYQSIAWIALFFLVHHFEERQQVGVQLFVLLCVCPDFLLGPITVLAVRRISYALLTNLDSLSARAAAATTCSAYQAEADGHDRSSADAGQQHHVSMAHGRQSLTPVRPALLHPRVALQLVRTDRYSTAASTAASSHRSRLPTTTSRRRRYIRR